MVKKVKTDNEYLRSMSKKVGNTDDGKVHTDNYYLKRIEAKIGQGGGGGYDDTDLKEKMGYDDIPVGENLQGQITDLADTVGDLDIPVDVSDLTDTQNTPFTPKAHTHSESDITDLGDYISKSNTDGLVKNDGTIDTTQYVSDVSGKADAADFDTLAATITYVDTTTETVEFYIVPRT